MATFVPVRVLMFDLDDTLYRNDAVPALMKQNITKYMLEKLKVPAEGLEARGRLMYNDYGTTLAGLRVQGYQIDYEDWHHDVHGKLPYSKLIQKDPELRQILQSLPYPKFIFTNADIKHAKTVLGILGIEDLFEDIICFESIMKAAEEKGISNEHMPVVCKPSTKAFELALAQAAQTLPELRPQDIVFFDDSTRNIAGATACGIRTVLVGTKGASTAALKEVDSLHELKVALPELWDKKATVDTGSKRILPVPGAELNPPTNGSLNPSLA